ncbi:MAG: hypothetical protein ACLVIY_04365 [Anaerobutyricum soehngenii]
MAYRFISVTRRRYSPLRDCSIVTATYELKEGGTGTVGIIGPKRMDYRKVVNTSSEI